MPTLNRLPKALHRELADALEQARKAARSAERDFAFDARKALDETVVPKLVRLLTWADGGEVD